jgi:ATP-binding cassette subfamily B protein
MFTLAWLVFRGQLTAGQVMTLTFYSFFIFGPLQEIGNIIMSYREAEASLINFDNVMKRPAERMPASPVHIGNLEKLSFSNVSFKHQTAQYKALDGISFDAENRRNHCICWPFRCRQKHIGKNVGGIISSTTWQGIL